jgi:hypothetical protein
MFILSLFQNQYEFLHKATQIALACKNTKVTVNDIEKRIKTLEEMSTSSKSNLEDEFKVIKLNTILKLDNMFFFVHNLYHFLKCLMGVSLSL